jgi:hypothetical protein
VSRPVAFHEQNGVLAKDQPEYLPLPVYRAPDGQVTSCWELDEDERAIVARTGKVYLTVLTFGRPLQPQIVSARPPAVPCEDPTCEAHARLGVHAHPREP